MDVQHGRASALSPVASRHARLSLALYTVFDALPLRRSHLLAWMAEPA